MRRSWTVLILLLICIKINAQIDTLRFIDGTYYVLDGDKIIYPRQKMGAFAIVEKGAEFPGGPNALQTWLKNNLEPDSTITSETSVKAIFTINTKGLPIAIVAQGDTINGRGKKVIKLIEAMPRWKPAIQGAERTVKIRLALPITFTKIEKQKK